MHAYDTCTYPTAAVDSIKGQAMVLSHLGDVNSQLSGHFSQCNLSLIYNSVMCKFFMHAYKPKI